MPKITMEAARVNAGMTQEQMAERLGVHRQTVLCWENGKRAINTAYLHLFCEIVGFSEDDIILPETTTKSS